MNLDFGEIADDKIFEELVAAYLQDLTNENEYRIINVDVKHSGTGVDGGRDILVTLKIGDGVVTFDRTWVVQCKFHASDISTDKIADINIPSLIHSYKACGYLLVCRQNPTSKLTEFFERLESNCRFDYKYTVWSGEQFKRFILVKSKKEILQQFFPLYYNYCVTNKIFA